MPRKNSTPRFCVTCGTALKYGQRAYCSKPCFYPKRIEKTCERCGSMFTMTPSQVANGKGRFCSRSCSWSGPWGSRVPLSERFWSKVDKLEGEDTCWVWTDKPNSAGYGLLVIDAVPRLAHRLAYELERGPIPNGIHVLHRCDNPPCVRPDHLFLGTNDENVADKVAKGRQPRGSEMASSKLTEADVIEIRRRFHAHEMSRAEMAREFGVCFGTIEDSVTGKTWRHLSE